MTAPPLDPTGADRRLRLVYTAVPSAEVAQTLARATVERRLAACASHWPIRSTYWWQGTVEEAGESAVLFKTSPKKLGVLFAYLARHHPYEVPDVHEIHVPRVHEPYIDWLFRTIDPGSAEPPLRPRGSPRGRGARRPRRTRAPRRRR